MTPQVLATDLDGTLIPLDGNAQNADDLPRIREQLTLAQMELIFVTGRHLASILAVMDRAQLPPPGWIIGDVGTSIYRRMTPGSAWAEASPMSSATPVTASTDEYQLVDEYAEHLRSILGDFGVAQLAQQLRPIDGLRPQEAEKQSQFKLSYYVQHDVIGDVADRVAGHLADASAPYTMVASRDPFTGDGLIDLLPKRVTKAYAMNWWASKNSIDRRAILYAGDSGNDAAVFAAGYRSIIVANADATVLAAAHAAHARSGWTDRIFAAPAPATSGVLSGLRHYTVRGN